MSRSTITSFVAMFALAACGGNGSGNETDAAVSAADADPNAPDADPNAPDAGPPGPDAAVGVACGDVVCEATQECCVSGETEECVEEGATCDGTTLTCDGAEDCPETGETCCQTVDGDFECVAQNSCEARTCQTADDCPNDGDECCESGTTMICAPTCGGGA